MYITQINDYPDNQLSSISSAPTELSLSEMTPELVYRILSFLDPKDRQRLAMTSVELSNVTIQESNFQISTQMKTFIHDMLSILSEVNAIEQMHDLEAIRSSLDVNFPNLVQIKDYLLCIKNQIVDVLATLGKEQLEALAIIPVPYFCESCFSVANVCRRIPDATRNVGSNALYDIYKELLELRELDRALEVARKMNNKNLLESALYDISKSFLDIGKVDRAIGLASEITEVQWHDLLIGQIVNVFSKKVDLLNTDEIDQAIEVASSIHLPDMRDYNLSEFSTTLLKAGQIDKAIEAAKLIQGQFSREELLSNILHVLLTRDGYLEEGKIGRVVELANSFLDQENHTRAIFKLMRALLEIKEFEKAIEVVKSIDEPMARMHAFREIYTVLLKAREIDRAIELVHSLQDCLDSSEARLWGFAMWSCCTVLLKIKEIDSAVRGANSIIDGNTRLDVFGELSNTLVGMGETDRAIEVALSIIDQETQMKVFDELIEGLLERGEIDKAIEAAHLIPDKERREHILKNLQGFLIAKKVTAQFLPPDC